MADKFKPGDPVEWNSHGGTAQGKVKKKLTAPMDIKGHHVAASPSNPEYLVETGSGAQAAHKPGALRKVSDKGGDKGSDKQKKS
jgi:hypothetical protein